MNPSDAGLKMLIVDDEPAALETICEGLSGENVQLFTAASAESALEQLPQIRPRIVLADLLLPGMSGLELLNRVQIGRASCRERV